MFALRLHPEDLTKPIDFTVGMWGHKLHGSTFKEESRQKVRRWPWCPWFMVDEPEIIRRYSFMVHTSDTPAMGREVQWLNNDKEVRSGRIYDVEYCGNPRDMMMLKVIVDSTDV